MRTATFVSDYSPTTRLHVFQTDDGDIILKIHGDGEMRIAMNGGRLHGENLVRVSEAFSTLIEVLENEKKSI